MFESVHHGLKYRLLAEVTTHMYAASQQLSKVIGRNKIAQTWTYLAYWDLV
jgi:hypothetical protein